MLNVQPLSSARLDRRTLTHLVWSPMSANHRQPRAISGTPLRHRARAQWHTRKATERCATPFCTDTTSNPTAMPQNMGTARRSIGAQLRARTRAASARCKRKRPPSPPPGPQPITQAGLFGSYIRELAVHPLKMDWGTATAHSPFVATNTTQKPFQPSCCTNPRRRQRNPPQGNMDHPFGVASARKSQ